MTSTSISALALAAGLLIGPATASAQSIDGKGPDMQNHASIQQAIDTMAAAFAAKNIDKVLTAYEEGGVVVGPDGAPVAGAALRGLFEQYVALDPKFTFYDHEIIQSGEIALHLTKWKLDGIMPDGTAIEQNGLSAVVLRRQEDGKWLMVIDHPQADQVLNGGR